jgi:hypothetical protein
MQQEYLAKPRLLAISGIDRALDSCRTEMAFERSSPPCYSSGAFCLSAMIGHVHGNHNVACLGDASAGHAIDVMPADDVQRAVSRISALYGDVYETADRIASTLPRKLGNGRNAGG